jgi:hypothetical protein
VRSFVLRKRGAKTGIRLVDYASLAAFIWSNVDQNQQQGLAKAASTSKTNEAGE